MAEGQRVAGMFHVGQHVGVEVRGLGLRGLVEVVRQVAVFVQIERLRGMAAGDGDQMASASRIRQEATGRLIDFPSLG